MITTILLNSYIHTTNAVPCFVFKSKHFNARVSLTVCQPKSLLGSDFVESTCITLLLAQMLYDMSVLVGKWMVCILQMCAYNSNAHVCSIDR